MQPRHFTNIVFAFVCGLYFALLQFSYFFLMEAFLTSQYLSYFITLFFWLCGFLIGLNLKREGLFARLLFAGVVAYYITWWMTRLAPFHTMLYSVAAICSVTSGLLPGYFFPFMAKRFQSIRHLLFHENNGFLLGILIAFKASIYCGSWFLLSGPILGAGMVVVFQVICLTKK